MNTRAEVEVHVLTPSSGHFFLLLHSRVSDRQRLPRFSLLWRLPIACFTIPPGQKICLVFCATNSAWLISHPWLSLLPQAPSSSEQLNNRNRTIQNQSVRVCLCKWETDADQHGRYRLSKVPSMHAHHVDNCYIYCSEACPFSHSTQLSIDF